MMKKKKRRLLTEEDFAIVEDHEKKVKKISTIVVIVIIALGCLIGLDIILVTKANIGPFLAVRTKVYDDGGTEEFYGIGYKVIKYHQKEGRQDTVLGSWGLKYSVTPIVTTCEDLAFALRNDSSAYQNYRGQYIQISGVISQVDIENHLIVLQYLDTVGGAYSLDVDFFMDDSVNLSAYKKGDRIILVGTLYNYKGKNDDNNRTVSLKNGFVAS